MRRPTRRTALCGAAALMLAGAAGAHTPYGQWVAEELSFENGRQLWVPKGFLHGFVTLQPETEVIYKCTDYYSPEADGAVRWDSCGIDWGLTGTPKLSEKDAAAVPLSEFDSPFTQEVAP